ncbi:hypothetical protein ACO0LD_23900 [Undibacterium sp. Ji83W]|uniref:hypothetical protein n=1 Tax=Undibacterium sp. Ji83W TaxID=3413043 RepID=UPI003BF39305
MQAASPAYLHTLKIVIPAQPGIHRICAVSFDAPYIACDEYPDLQSLFVDQ